MKFRKWHFALSLSLSLSLIFLSPVHVFAEKRYISDTLIVSLRDSASLRGEVISYLRSGDLLEILKEDEDGFILVKTVSGDQGWIQKKYTIDEKPKDLIIADLEGQVKSLTTKLESVAASKASLQVSSQNIKSQVRDREKEVAQLQKTISGLKASVGNAERKYEELEQNSQRVDEIVSERDRLLEQINTIDKELALLRVENAELIQTDRILWFLAGFGVFLVGWIMGKFSRKSRRSKLSM